MNNEQQREILMYYVLMTDFNNGIKLMGKHDIEDDAVEHEEQLCKAYPDNHICVGYKSVAHG
jgi:hypothetical protein